MPRDSDRGEEKEEEDEGALLLSRYSILPDELVQKVLSFLPIADIIKSGLVCKRWHEVVLSQPLSWTMMPPPPPHKPWFFTTCFFDYPSGRVYDPCLLRWRKFDFPAGLERRSLLTSSSCGLVGLMSCEGRNRLLVGNPITRDWKRLPRLPGRFPAFHDALALSFDRRTRGYSVVVAKCTQPPGKFLRWHLSIHVYESTTQLWATPFAQDLGSWRGGDEAVVCDGVLYYLIYPPPEQRPHLVALDLAEPPSTIESLIQVAIPAPRDLAGARLVGLPDKLVMVGGIAWRDWIVELILWELEDKKTWREVSRISIDRDDCWPVLRANFICCGAGDLVFVQCAQQPKLLLMFDVRRKVWETGWCPDSGHLGWYDLYGFCLEPRLDVAP